MADNIEVFDDLVHVDDPYQIGEEQGRAAHENIAGNVEIDAAPDTANVQMAQSGSETLRRQMLEKLGKHGKENENPDYTAMREGLGKLDTQLNEPVSIEHLADGWRNLKQTYLSITDAARKYVSTHTNAISTSGRARRRHARELLSLCRSDMSRLELAMERPDTIGQQSTWKQLLDRAPVDENHSVPTEATAGAGVQNDTGQTAHPKGSTAGDFMRWGNLLDASEKGGLGWNNSALFEKVQDALQETGRVLTQDFTDDRLKNIKLLHSARGVFGALLAACRQYTARSPRTQKGRERRGLVLMLLDFAAKDALGCEEAVLDFSAMEPEEQAKETWSSVLGKARSVRLTVDDFSKLESPTSGQASEIVKLSSQEGNHDGVKYFKKEDSLDLDVVKDKGDQAHRVIAEEETRKRFPKLSKKDMQAFRRFDEDSDQRDVDRMNFSQEVKPAAYYYVQRLKQLYVNINELLVPLGIADEGGIANMSRRNVATSRVAELLGVGDLVARSRSAEIYDKATGKTIRGNLMDQAEGVGRNKVGDKLKKGEYSAGFMRDMMNLQVLDMLCGQVDRHTGNLMFRTDEKTGKVFGIQGIDNDGAFGTGVDAASAKEYNRKDARVFDPNSLEMVIPFMDAKLARRIEELDEQMLKYVLYDLLTEPEVEAAMKRLKLLKNGIRKAKEEQLKGRFLENEKDWIAANAGQTMIEQYNKEALYQGTGDENAYHWANRNYFGRIVLNRL